MKLPNWRTALNSMWSQVTAACWFQSIWIYGFHGVCAISWKQVIIIQLLVFTEYHTSAKNIPKCFTYSCFKSSCYLIIVKLIKSGEGSIIHRKTFNSKVIEQGLNFRGAVSASGQSPLLLYRRMRYDRERD